MMRNTAFLGDRHDKRFPLRFSPTPLADFGMSSALIRNRQDKRVPLEFSPSRSRVVCFGVSAIGKSVIALANKTCASKVTVIIEKEVIEM